MRIAIIGAGIAGVTTAYELAADGHQVTVFERRGSVAAEASFANSGLVVPGLALPWSRPVFSIFASALQRQRWKASRDKALPERQERLLKLAVYSHGRLQALRRSLALDYERTEGMLVLLRGERDKAGIEPGLELLQKLDVTARLLDADQCRAAEPGLNAEIPLHGGILLPRAEVGNCRQLAHQLRLEAQRLGVQFRFHTTVRSIEPGATVRLTREYTPSQDGPGAPARNTEAGDTQPAEMGPMQDSFDAAVVCAAQESVALLRPLKLRLPLASVQGCSITAPLRQLEAHPDLGPRAALLDLHQQIHISRIGQRVRVVGTEETALHEVLNDWFPGAMVAGQVQRWQGVHAELPDGLPVIGNSGLAGVWLNLGHGDNGFTLACGAARVVAEQIAHLTPEVDTAGLDIGRFA